MSLNISTITDSDSVPEQLKKLKKQIEDVDFDRLSGEDFAAGTLRGAFDVAHRRLLEAEMKLDFQKDDLKKEFQDSIKEVKRSLKQLKTRSTSDDAALRNGLTTVETKIEDGQKELVALQKEVSDLKKQLKKTGWKRQLLEIRYDIYRTRLMEEKLDVKMKNSRQFRDHHKILPVGILPDNLDTDWENGLGLLYPEDGYHNIQPKTIREFCSLKEERRLGDLVKLLDFYDVGDWEDWCDDDMESKEETTRSCEGDHPSLKEAIKAHPMQALAALASELGVDFYKILFHRLHFNHHEVGCPKRLLTNPDTTAEPSVKRQREE
ncbi:MAG: hypothetical protein M1823_004486 [Watsoniomyces obsoletus]|nr:MAG: hypothetical protein M1823_004486 [Watsoniomyces obsoletus]